MDTPTLAGELAGVAVEVVGSAGAGHYPTSTFGDGTIN